MNLWQMSISGAVLILAIVVIRAITINKLPKKTFLVLWGIVLLRLLIPFSIPSIFSVYSIFSPSTADTMLVGDRTDEVGFVMPQGQALQLDSSQHLPTDSIAFNSVCFVVWCVGMIICTMFFAISYLRCRIEFQFSLPVYNDYADKWLREHSLKRPISIRQSDKISSPLTYGVFRPVILMPKATDWTDTKQLPYILTHEYIHIYRYDTITKLIATIALCIHWFNPMVWVMYLLFNRDMELACDESVIRQFGDNSKSAYSFMLINMEAKQSGLLPFCNSFSKNAIEERITAIMKIKKVSILSLVLACFIVIGTATAFVTSAQAGNYDMTAPSILGIGDTDMSKLAKGTEEGYQSLLKLKTENYFNQTVADFNNAVLNWANQHWEESYYADIIENDIALYHFPEYLTTEEKNFLALSVRASNVENSVAMRTRYGLPEIDPDLSFEILRENNKANQPLWVSLQYGFSYHFDPDIITVGERDNALANMINEIQSWCYKVNLNDFAKMSPDEVLNQLKEIADNNSTNTIQFTILENYYIFNASPMFQ